MMSDCFGVLIVVACVYSDSCMTSLWVTAVHSVCFGLNSFFLHAVLAVLQDSEQVRGKHRVRGKSNSLPPLSWLRASIACRVEVTFMEALFVNVACLVLYFRFT